jgi:hypothetical protein
MLQPEQAGDKKRRRRKPRKKFENVAEEPTTGEPSMDEPVA